MVGWLVVAQVMVWDARGSVGNAREKHGISLEGLWLVAMDEGAKEEGQSVVLIGKPLHKLKGRGSDRGL